MSIELTGNELYKLYKFEDGKVYLFMYKKTNKSFHPGFDGYLALRSKRNKVKIKWFAIGTNTIYRWNEVRSIDSNHGKAMIKVVFEKNLNPPLQEVLY
ncbi:MAG: hypothetical protein ACOCRO_05885 [Halanaerobiales bacterium]